MIPLTRHDSRVRSEVIWFMQRLGSWVPSQRSMVSNGVQQKCAKPTAYWCSRRLSPLPEAGAGLNGSTQATSGTPHKKKVQEMLIFFHMLQPPNCRQGALARWWLSVRWWAGWVTSNTWPNMAKPFGGNHFALPRGLIHCIMLYLSSWFNHVQPEISSIPVPLELLKHICEIHAVAKFYISCITNGIWNGSALQ